MADLMADSVFGTMSAEVMNAEILGRIEWFQRALAQSDIAPCFANVATLSVAALIMLWVGSQASGTSWPGSLAEVRANILDLAYQSAEQVEQGISDAPRELRISRDVLSQVLTLPVGGNRAPDLIDVGALTTLSATMLRSTYGVSREEWDALALRLCAHADQLMRSGRRRPPKARKAKP